MDQNNSTLDKLEGQFTYCIYKSFNYAIMRFDDKHEGSIVVTGDLADVKLDEDYIIFGEYVNHPKYGFQFKVMHYELDLPSSLDSVIAYLSSDLFKGIGKRKATKIAEYFGEDALKILKDEPERIQEVDLKPKDQQIIMNVLKTNLQFEDSFYYLISLGIPSKDLNKIINKYQANAKDIITDNPYRLYYDFYGFSFLKCEEVAHRLGLTFDNPNRISAMIAYLASDFCFRTGNTYLDYNELEHAFYANAQNAPLSFDEALEEAINKKIIYEKNGHFYSKIQYLAEDIIARFLHDNNETFEVDETFLSKELNKLEDQYGIKYADKQAEAFYEFYKNKISFIVGGPGTGKTTIVKALVESIHNSRPTYDLHVVAPTGRAAKRISELCNVESSTIHSLLKWDKENNTFSFNDFNPLLIDVLIIDEFSMVDSWLFAELVKALPEIKLICIIGDDNQLPSVGPGNLLNEIIASNCFKITRLDRIYRQDSRSDIIELSYDILNNSIDFKKYQNDILLIDDNNPEIKNIIVDLFKQYLDDGFSLNDLQLLAPMYKGHLGIDVLNDLIQSTFNKKDDTKAEYQTKYRLYREGDKILQLKNQNSDEVYNGDIGEILKIAYKDKKATITARFDENIVEYQNDDLTNIALAYAISVHKSQGGEYPIVFFAFNKSQMYMLNKNLIYTAISRASNKLILIGDPEIFKKGAIRAMQPRKTSLKDFILEYFNF